MFDNIQELLVPEQVSIILVTVLISILIVVLGKHVKKIDVNESPKGFAQLGVLYVETIDNMIISNMGEKMGRKFSTYLGSIFIYLLLANTIGLFGFETPTSNLSVTLVFALITWIMIQVTSIKSNGIKGYFKGFFEPIFPFVIPNVIGAIAPLISLSMRLFGNVLSGGIIMTLLYTFTNYLSSFVPVIGGFNFIAIFITPIIHLYFDLFAGFLQAFLFITLTSILVAVEYTE